MSEVQAQIQSLEAQLSQAKELVNHKAMAQKLYGNREFRKLILEEFCVNECARYVQESADPALHAEARADALAIAQAAGHLRRWLSVKCQMGLSAEREMEQIEEALVEARAEEDAAQ